MLPDRRSWGAGVAPPLFSRRFLTVLGLGFASNPFAALKALTLIVRNRRVRGWNLLSALAARHARAYAVWIDKAEPAIMARYRCDAPQEDIGSRLAVLIFGDGAEGPAQAESSVRSVRNALGDKVAVISFAQDSGGALSMREGDLADALNALHASWLLPIRAGDQVCPLLGDILARAVPHHASCDVIFWDEDELEATGRHGPWLKGEWDSLLFQTCDTLSGASLVATSSLRAATMALPAARCDLSGISDAITQLALTRDMKVAHVPLIMTHRDAGRAFLSAEERCALLRGRFQLPNSLTDISSETKALDAALQWPTVSIIIPTRDQPALLRACLHGLEMIDYAGELELIIVDNGSQDLDALAILAHYRDSRLAQVLDLPGPFNFSALVNNAVRTAKGRYLCLLNNDVEPLDGTWLRTMVQHAMGEGVGAVGCKLLYPDHSLQHGGVAIGVGGAAGHVNKYADGTDGWRRFWGDANRKVSAVTAACMVLRKDHFQCVGGLDAERFAIAFNDVDLCLKLAQAGLQNLYIADAQLIHHESKSRGKRLSKAAARHFASELSALQAKWQTIGHVDPRYSPLFLPSAERCILNF